MGLQIHYQGEKDPADLSEKEKRQTKIEMSLSLQDVENLLRIVGVYLNEHPRGEFEAPANKLRSELKRIAEAKR
jgi:hypothetical protein